MAKILTKIKVSDLDTIKPGQTKDFILSDYSQINSAKSLISQYKTKYKLSYRTSAIFSTEEINTVGWIISIKKHQI